MTPWQMYRDATIRNSSNMIDAYYRRNIAVKAGELNNAVERNGVWYWADTTIGTCTHTLWGET